MQWTHPICSSCYRKREDDRLFFSVIHCDPELCCDCGLITEEGLYYRVDPRTVAYPALEMRE